MSGRMLLVNQLLYEGHMPYGSHELVTMVLLKLIVIHNHSEGDALYTALCCSSSRAATHAKRSLTATSTMLLSIKTGRPRAITILPASLVSHRIYHVNFSAH